MPLLSWDRVRRALREGERGGVYFLFGDEAFLKAEAVDAIVAAHLDPATRDFNLDRLHGDDVATETLASIIQTPPMMAEWRVVVVRDAQGLAGSSRARGVVEDALERPLPGLVLILSAAIPSRSRAKFYKTLKREARAIEFDRLELNDVPGWLMGRARADGMELDADAARALAGAVGSELGILTRELAKLRDYTADRDRITADDVEAVVGPIARQNRWAWFDLVGAGRLADARSALPVLLDGRESGVGLVLGLGTHFLRLGLAVNGGARALKSELPRRQKWLSSRLTKQARRWTPEAIHAALEDLLRADRLLKSTALDDRQVVDELLLRIQARREESTAA